MRNLKRMLSLVMASAMLISMMVVSAGASYEDFTDSDEIVNTEAVNAMVNLGVINGYDDDEDGVYDFQPETLVTRAQMAKMIAVALNGGEDLTQEYKCDYTDVVGHWAYNYIAYCTSFGSDSEGENGVISGRGDGTFDPDGYVTGVEAAKMMLVALGYDAATEGLVGSNWNNKTLTLGKSVGLFNGSSVGTSLSMSRDYAALLIYNGVNANVASYNASTGYVDFVEGSFLSKYFDVVLVEGTVTGNDFTVGIDAEGETTVKVAKIDGVADNANDDGSYYFGSENFDFEVETAADLLGRYVSFYTTSDGTVIGTVVPTGADEVVTYSGTKSIYALVDGDYELIVTEADGDTPAEYFAVTGKYGADIDTDTTVDAVTLAAGQYANVIVKGSTVTGVYVYSYTFGQVDEIDDEEVTIDGDEYVIEDGEIVGYEDLEEGDYVNFIEVNGVVYVELADSTSGTFTRYTDGESYYATMTVGGTKYDVAANVGTFDTNEEVTIYFDVVGNIVMVEGEASTATNSYGLVIAATVTTSGDWTDSATTEYTAQVQMVDEDGNTVVCIVDTLDGVTAEEAGAAWYNSNADTGLNTGGDLYEVVGKVVEYAIDGNYIVLKATTGAESYGGVSGEEAIKNGSLVVGNNYATEDTVFFLKTTGEDGVATYSAYTGYANVPTFNATDGKAYVVVDENNVLAIYAEGSETDASTTFGGDWMYIYMVDGTDGTVTYVDAVVDGEVVEDIAIDGTSAATGFQSYTYKDGVYYTEAVSDTANLDVVLAAEVGVIGTTSAMIGGEEKTTSDAVVFEYIDKEIDVTGVSLTKGNVVSYIYDEDSIVAIVIVGEDTDDFTEAQLATAAVAANFTASSTTETGYDLVSVADTTSYAGDADYGLDMKFYTNYNVNTIVGLFNDYYTTENIYVAGSMDALKNEMGSGTNDKTSGTWYVGVYFSDDSVITYELTLTTTS